MIEEISCAKSSGPATSDLVSTTAQAAPQSLEITAERTMRSTETASPSKACTTSTRSTFAARVCFWPRAPPFQRAISVSRGRIASMMPISCESGMRAHTQSPTATVEFWPLVTRAANSARNTPCSDTTAGNPLSKRTTQAMVIVWRETP